MSSFENTELKNDFFKCFFNNYSIYSKIDSTASLIESFIEYTLGITTDYFSVSSQDSMLNTMDSINNTLSLLLGGIASISLIVGGIGVMNVMLVSVTERTKEIGIRKAIRSKKKR